MSKILFMIIFLATFSFAEEGDGHDHDHDHDHETENGMCKDGKDEYCAKCESDKCTLCYASIVQESGQCKAPTTTIEHCVGYKSLTECATCHAGYTGTSCKAIEIAKCLSVDSQYNTKCALCDGVTPEESTTTCEGTACTIADCRSCKGTGDAQTCSLCNDDMEPATDKKSCVAVTKHENGCTTASSCTECAMGYYVNSASSATAMTCAKSTRYGSVSIVSGVILSWLALMKL